METDMNSGVYWIRNKVNNKRYAGSSGNIKQRWREHKNKLRRGCHDNPHLQSAWNIYGEENFEFAVIAYMDADKALVFEDYLLKNYPNMFEYNIAKSATAPMLGRRHTEEAKQKMREAQGGKNHPLFGTRRSEETKRKLSESHSGNKNYGYIDIPKEKIDEMKRLHGQGYTYEKIADSFGISTKTVWRRLNNISQSQYQ